MTFERRQGNAKGLRRIMKDNTQPDGKRSLRGTLRHDKGSPISKRIVNLPSIMHGSILSVCLPKLVLLAQHYSIAYLFDIK